MNSIVSFIGYKYGHLPFDKARCETLSYLNSIKIYDNEFTIERDKEYTGFYNNYIYTKSILGRTL